MRKFALVSVGIVAFLMARGDGASPEDAADAIYFGGDIVTINDAQPTAEAVAARDGRILAVGAQADVMQRQGGSTRVVDLRGRTLLPGFIDGHGHVSMVGFQAVSANLLPPPDGPNASVAELQKTLREFMGTSAIPEKFGVVFGFGYDDSQLKEQRHPTRDDLDAVSKDLPVLIVHQSGHLGTLNSKALELAGIVAQTPNPAGGVIRRRAGAQEPSGVLEESAFFGALMKVFPKLTEAQAVAMLEEGQNLYMKFGYTTVQDGRATLASVHTAIAAARAGKLKVDIVSYPDVLQIGQNTFMTGPYYKPTYTDHFRIGGVKLTLDGSPQGKTAWLTQPYFKPPARSAGRLRRLRRCLRRAGGRGLHDRLQEQLADPHPRQRRHGHRPVDQEHARCWAAGAGQGSPASPDPWPDTSRRPGRCAQGVGCLSLALSDAHLLLGRLASRIGARARACRKHLPDRLAGAAGHAVHIASRRAGGLAFRHSRALRHRQPHDA